MTSPTSAAHPETESFYIGDRRATVSLGPLNQRSYCSYRCAFCYVNNEQFVRYDTLTLDDVVQWLAQSDARSARPRVSYSLAMSFSRA